MVLQQGEHAASWHRRLAPAGAKLPDWYAGMMQETSEGRVFVYVTCRAGHLSCCSARVHRIDRRGVVSPSYVCPHAGCQFHEFVTLEGWAA